MKSLKKRKEILKEITLSNCTEENATILFLLLSDELDFLIQGLNDRKTVIRLHNMSEKKYLTSEEQFVRTLSYLIESFDRDFWFIQNNRMIILKCLIHSDEAKEILYSKKYLGDNENISYYTLLFQKLILENFIKNIKNSNQNVKDLLDKLKIKEFNYSKELYSLFRVICLCNCNSYHLIYLFHHASNDESHDFYQMQLEIMLNRTIKLKKRAYSFLKDFSI